MRNFHRLASNINVEPLMMAVMSHPEMWDVDTLRTTHPQSPHTEVSDIWLRFNDLTLLENVSDVIDQHESINYPAFWKLPGARQLIFGIMAQVEGERLGRVLITRVDPGKRIAPHVDGGDHAAYYDRFHVVLQGLPGSLFRCGDETVQMLTGELWWFNNAIEHEVINNSTAERIHLIVDCRVSR